MDIYDSRHFYINKRLISSLGLWPYDNRSRNFLKRFAVLTALTIMIVPHVISFYINFGINAEILLENCFSIMYFLGVVLKVVTTILAEERMKIVYESTARDFYTIAEKHERDIMFEYAERGRLISLYFIIYMFSILNFYITTPSIPAVMDLLFPLNESRSWTFISNGDFLVDKYKYYVQIYLFDACSSCFTVYVISAIDPMYAILSEHCISLFAIIKYRLKKCTKIANQNFDSSKTNTEQETCKYITEIIQLHEKIINFTKLLEVSYSVYFLLEVELSIMGLSVTAVLILIRLDDIFELTRFSLILAGLLIHLFYLTWPSQKMIDHSSDLYKDTYLNEWYDVSIRNQNLLKFMALRCSEPCQLTAGGLYLMNFINFASVVKTSVSYITVFSSMR